MIEDIIDDNNVVLHVLKPPIAGHLLYLVTDIIIGRCRASKGGPSHPLELGAWRKSLWKQDRRPRTKRFWTSAQPYISTAHPCDPAFSNAIRLV